MSFNGRGFITSEDARFKNTSHDRNNSSWGNRGMLRSLKTPLGVVRTHLSEDHRRLILYRSAEPVLTPMLPQERRGTIANPDEC